MSAEELGARLVAGVEVVGLGELLLSIQATNLSSASSESPAPFGLPPLDQLLNAHLDLQAYTALEAARHDRGSSPVARVSGESKCPVQVPPVVEFVSNGPGVGRTQLLYLLAALAVLPSKQAGIAIGAHEATVVILDTEERFNVERLAHVMRHHLRACSTTASRNLAEAREPVNPLTDQSIEDITVAALAHVHVLRPPSYKALLTDLAELPNYLLKTDEHHSGSRRLHALLLDSIGSFQREARQMSTSSEEPALGMPDALQEIQRRFSCAIVATASITSTSDRGLLAKLRPLRLLFTRKPVPPFPSGQSVEEALTHRHQRQAVVERGVFEAAELGRDGTPSGRGFRFYVRDEGVGFGSQGDSQ